MRPLRWLAVACFTATGVTACGSSGSSPPDPHALLAQAKHVLDTTSALHFALTSESVPSSGGAVITGASGDVGRPDRLKGAFQLAISGFAVTVKVLAAGGKFYAQPPFQSHYQLTNPASYGVGDPSQLINPNTGLSSLLLKVEGARSAGRRQIGSEVVDEVVGKVPGTAVPVLPDADRAAAVTVTASIDPSSKQLRQISLTGPFVTKADSTFTVTLTNYGERLDIALP